MNKFYFSLLSIISIGSANLSAQSFEKYHDELSPNAVTLDSTNLPIVGVYTYMTSIPDEPKIKAFMAIIDHGYNSTNRPTDTTYTYYNYAGIEMRGSISQSFLWPQKSYNVETRDTFANPITVPIMGMPKNDDWVLYGPYDDHTLMKNVLTYELVRQMGYWAPRTKHCELLLNDFINWNYKGVYVMMEKVKRGKNRVNISKLDTNDNSGDSLTGGYIVAVDKNINKPDSGWYSAHPQNANLFYTYKYPGGDAITLQQKTYIQSYINTFENSVSSPLFANPVLGYRKYIDVTSFIDFFFIQELSKNVDAYKRSAYLTKDKDSKGGKLIAGPHWDYNSAWDVQIGGCESFASDTGWTYNMTCWVNSNFPVPFWWTRLLQDTNYTHDMKCRWIQLRSTTLNTANIFHIIDSVASYVSTASARQFQQWNITANYQTEVNDLKTWINKRLTWLDANIPGKCWNTDVEENNFENSLVVFPNPASDEVNVEFYLGIEKNIQLELFDAVGRKIQTMDENKFHSGDNTIQLNLKNYSLGIYFLKVQSGNSVFTKKFVKVKQD